MMPHSNIDGRAVAAEMIEKIGSDVAALKKDHWSPKLVSIKIGDNPSVDRYIRNQKRNADTVGIEFVERHFPADISADEVTATLEHPQGYALVRWVAAEVQK